MPDNTPMAACLTFPQQGWPPHWGQPRHAQVRAELLRGLHGGRPFSPQAGFYAPALLPVNTTTVLALDEWLTDQLSATDVCVTADEALIWALARLRASVCNHYRLCKPLALQSFPVQRLDSALLAETRADLHTWATDARVLYDLFVTQMGWPQACWRAFQRWMASTLPMLLALGYHDALSHAGQVARWCVLHARLQEKAGQLLENPHWFALQAAMLGWFHDPKLHIHYSIDNLGTHPVVASVLAQQLVQHVVLIQPLTEAWQACHPESSRGEAPEALAILGQNLTDALLINSDSRYVMMAMIEPALARQLPDDLQPEWHSWVARRLTISPESTAHLASPSPALLNALQQTYLDSGFIGLDATLWQHATAWWCTRTGQRLSPAMLYQMILHGDVGPTGEDVAAVLQQWLQQAMLMGEQPLIHWKIPGTLLLAHHHEASHPLLAECLAFADPLMLSPHKVIAARPSHEPFLARLASYLHSLHHNLADLTTPVGQHVARDWETILLQTLWHAAGLDTPLPNVEALLEADTWPLGLASATELGGGGALHTLMERLKASFDEAERSFIQRYL